MNYNPYPLRTYRVYSHGRQLDLTIEAPSLPYVVEKLAKWAGVRASIVRLMLRNPDELKVVES